MAKAPTVHHPPGHRISNRHARMASRGAGVGLVLIGLALPFAPFADTRAGCADGTATCAYELPGLFFLGAAMGLVLIVTGVLATRDRRIAGAIAVFLMAGLIASLALAAFGPQPSAKWTALEAVGALGALLWFWIRTEPRHDG